MSPNPVPGFNGDQTVYIYGSGFVSGNGLKVHVTWPNGQGDLTGSQVSFVSSSQLSIRINVGTVAANWTARVINPDGGQSNIFSFTVTAATSTPTISSMSPNPVPGYDGDQTVFIYGSGFVNGNGLKVHVTWPNGQGDLTGTQVSFVSSSQLSIRINVGTVAANWTARVINPDGGQSNIFNFTVTAATSTPTISSMSPNPVPGFNGDQTVYIYGSGFVSGNGLKVHVTWPNGQGDLTGTQVSLLSSSQLSIRINVGTVAANWTARVINPDGGQSNIFNFTVTAATSTPTISSMSPNPVPGFNGDQTVYIYGSGFVSGNGLKVHVTWPNGQGDLTGSQVSFVSSSQLSIRINVGTVAANWTARVINPDGGQSNIFSFTVTAATSTPTISSMSPNPVPGYDGDQTVFIYGSGFVSGNGLKVHVTWPNGQGDLTGTQVSFVSSSQLSIRINVGTVAANWTARVINPDGGQSNIFSFTVTAATSTPTISSMSPNPVPGYDGDQTVYIYGSGFVSGNGLKVHVTWPNGQGDLTGTQVSFVSSSQLSIRINVGTVAANWTARVINPDGGQSNIFSFTVTAATSTPTISSMSPNPVPGFNGDQTVYIYGSGFVSGNGLKVHVTWPNGAGRSDGIAGELRFVKPAFDPGSTWGRWRRTDGAVINPDGGQSNIFSFTVTAATSTPTISSMSPNPVPGYDGDQTVFIYGSGFVSGNGLKVHVTWPNGQGDLTGTQVSFVSSSQLSIRINVGTVAANWTARVINPDGGQSNIFSFTVTAATSTPTISSMSPNPVPGYDGDQTVFIYGSGFVNGNGLKVHVTWPNGQGDLTGTQVSFVSSSQLSIRINVGTVAANWTARVINPDGGQSNIFSFTVTAATSTPTISSMSPNPVPGFNGDQTVYIYGSGFVSGNGLKVHVTWPNGQGDLTGTQVSFVSSSQLSIRINVGTVAANWTARSIRMAASPTSSASP